MDKKYKYRFKTRQEMEKEFGQSWKSRSGWNDENCMDYLLGTDIDVPLSCIGIDGEIIKRFDITNMNGGYFDIWVINHKMLVIKQYIPNYNPKIFVRE